MAGRRNKDYLIDVAKQHKYRNQSEEYQRKYLKWRTDPKNPYGYTFIHDSRIRTYVDGEGFYEETAVSSERTALKNCYRVLGASLLIMAAVAFVRYLVMWLAFGIDFAGRTYHSEISVDNTSLSTGAAYTMLSLNILEYLLPVVFLSASTRMPMKIAVPLRKSKKISSVSSVMMMLVIMAIGRAVNNILAWLLNMINIDIPYYDYIKAASPTAEIICSLGQHVVIAVLIEIILRGYLLQMLRQFGDEFAVVITATAGCLLLYDITQAGYMFCVGIYTGIITIRSGSIKNACIMRIIARYVNYILTFISSLVGDYWGAVIELVTCGLILASALPVYINLNKRRRWSFDVNSAETSITRGEKYRMMLTTPWFWFWLIPALAMSVMLIRII